MAVVVTIVRHVVVCGDGTQHVDLEVELSVRGLVVVVVNAAMSASLGVVVIVEEGEEFRLAVVQLAVGSLEKDHQGSAASGQRF